MAKNMYHVLVTTHEIVLDRPKLVDQDVKTNSVDPDEKHCLSMPHFGKTNDKLLVFIPLDSALYYKIKEQRLVIITSFEYA